MPYKKVNIKPEVFYHNKDGDGFFRISLYLKKDGEDITKLFKISFRIIDSKLEIIKMENDDFITIKDKDLKEYFISLFEEELREELEIFLSFIGEFDVFDIDNYSEFKPLGVGYIFKEDSILFSEKPLLLRMEVYNRYSENIQSEKILHSLEYKKFEINVINGKREDFNQVVKKSKRHRLKILLSSQY